MNHSTQIKAEQMGLDLRDIITDGCIHRFSTPDDKSGQQSGWYVADNDGGVVGDWRNGEKWTWRNNTSDIKKYQSQRNKRRDDTLKTQLETAEKAQALWSQGATPMWMPQLKNKRTLSLGTRQKDKSLLTPLYDISGKLWNLQIIREDGSKRFLKGGKKKGCFFQIGKVNGKLYIAEGFSTAATVHMHVDRGAAVFVAFDAGNLKPVALELRKRYPHTKFIIAADNDCWKEHNTGLIKGREAAAAVNGELIYPTFENVDTSSKPTDFNDLYCLGGL